MLAGAPAMAQLDSKQTVAQVKELLKSKSPETDKEISKLAKAFKKDATTLTAIGREYMDAKNYAKAEEYANMALKATKNSCGDAWVLLGDIAIINDNGNAAAEKFQQAIYFDAKNPAGYRRYASMMAKADPAGSVATLEQLAQNVPGYPWELEAAKIYDRAGKVAKALEYYEKVPMTKMEDGDLGSYATGLYLSGKFDKALEVAEFGAKKSPRYPAFNRLAMYTLTEKKEFDKAGVYCNRLFHESDSAKFSSFDYKYAALASIGMQKYDEAVEFYNKQMTIAEDAASQAAVLRDIADAYKQKGDQPEARKYYAQYMEKNPTATANDWAGWANIYRAAAIDETGAEQEADAKEAIRIYTEMGKKFEDAKDFGLFMCARTSGIIDPDQSKGLAEPYYSALYDSIVATGGTSATDMSQLKESCQYLGIYYFKFKDDNATAKKYFEKLKEIDPENELADQVLEIINK